jgi:hypothetical protein
VTKRREPLSDQLTLTVIADLIGWDRCAAIVGRGERQVRNWSDPDCETEIRRIDAERLDKAYLDHGGHYPPFHRLHALRLDLAGRGYGAADLAFLAGGAAKETGEAVAAMLHAAANADSPEAHRIARLEIVEAIDKLTDGLAALDAAEAARPMRCVSSSGSAAVGRQP